MILGLAGCELAYEQKSALVASFQIIPPEGPPPLEVLFDGSPSVGAEEWHWDFGDGSYGEGEIVRHTYGVVGDYTVILTVQSRGETDSTWAIVRVREYDPVACFSVDGEFSGHGGPFLGGEIVYLDASCSYDPDGEIVAWHWDFGDGTTGEGEQVTHWWPGPSCGGDPLVFVVTLTVEDDDGHTDVTSTPVTIEGQCHR